MRGRVLPLLPPVIVAAGFGPYVIAKSVRTEHILLYALLPIAVGWLAVSRRTLLRVPAITLQALILMAMLVWAFAVTTLYSGTASLLQRPAIAHAESLLQPLAVVVVLAAFIRIRAAADAELALRRTCQVLIALLAANAVAILVHIVLGVSWFLEPFLPAFDPTRGNVWTRALSTGRHLGIFAMPFDAGLMYSLGLLTWVYVERNGWGHAFGRVLSLALLVVGAVSSVSKVSLLVGPVLFLAFLLTGRHAFKRLFRPRNLWIAVLMLGGIVIAIRYATWPGRERALRYFTPDMAGDLLALYGAGRFGAGAGSTAVSSYFARVWSSSPLAGLGFGHRLTVDSAFLDMYATGGVVNLLLYVGLLGILGISAIRHFASSNEAKLLTFMFLLVGAASLGAPVITANRFAPAFWTLFMLLAARVHLARSADRHRVG